MTDRDQREMLGAFVRAHRERLRPDTPGGRRRTPGLRREELAVRAGISPTWCAWIEQGREVEASPKTLSRLAHALHLTRAERAYLFELAGRRDPESGALPPVADAPLSLRLVLEQLNVPAYALDPLWNACHWNEAAARLFIGWLDAKREPNLLRFLFLEKAARTLIPDWEDRARRALDEFRADYSKSFADPHAQALVDGLCAESPSFARIWGEQGVREREGGVRSFRHPEDGMLTFRQHTFSPAERPDFKLVVLTPVPPPSGTPRPPS